MIPQLTKHWLEKLCGFIPGVHSALLMVPDRDAGSMRTIERWPADLKRSSDFAVIVKYALKKTTAVYLPKAHKIDGKTHDYYALPYFVQSKLAGVIVVKVISNPKISPKWILSTLRQGINWLSLTRIDRTQSLANTQQENFYSRVVGLLSACFDQRNYEQGLIRLVTELSREFDCERVAFAEIHANQCQVKALSNSAGFDKRSNLLQKIAGAMEEAISQDSIILFPNATTKLIKRAHQDLARKSGSGALCSFPLIYQQKVFGAITLLRNGENPFDSTTVDLCQQSLSLITAFLALKREEEKSLFKKIGTAIKKQLASLFGIQFLSLKLMLSALILVIASTYFIQGDFRISANAQLEGKIQRVVAAPISGYLLSAFARAGDTVQAGDVMASLDDSELKLELVKQKGELHKIRREYRQAQSERDLVKVRIVSEQINQTIAEMDLTQQQIDNINLTAPFDGVVIEGDLSQLLGSPIERGDTLFKIAPLEGYRIILTVDESQISYIKPGQTGTLTLSSLFDQNIPLTVERITAVAKAENSANSFRVEASLQQAPDLLRPGMEGIGKIDISRERLLWIWTREITDWIRLWVWSWWP